MPQQNDQKVEGMSSEEISDKLGIELKINNTWLRSILSPYLAAHTAWLMEKMPKFSQLHDERQCSIKQLNPALSCYNDDVICENEGIRNCTAILQEEINHLMKE